MEWSWLTQLAPGLLDNQFQLQDEEVSLYNLIEWDVLSTGMLRWYTIRWYNPLGSANPRLSDSANQLDFGEMFYHFLSDDTL